MNRNPRVPGDRPLMATGNKYNSRKVLGFIDTEGSGINEPGDPYLYLLTKNYSNVSIFPVVHTNVLDRYLNNCNEIDNHNRTCDRAVN